MEPQFLIDPTTPDFRNDPYGLWARLREQGPICRVSFPNGSQSWLITSYQEARAALADPRLTVNEQWGRGTDIVGHVQSPIDLLLAEAMSAKDPPAHTRLRGLVQKAFTPRRIESIQPQVQQIANTLLDEIANRRTVDLIAEFAFPLPIMAICILLGMPVDDRFYLRSRFDEVISAISDDKLKPAGQQAAKQIRRYLLELFEAKRSAESDDLLTALINAQGSADKLSNDELVSMAALLLIAGHETTMNLIANGTLTLLLHPDKQVDLRADLSLIPAAVEEFLRYESPLHTIPVARYAAEPVEIGGITVSAGERVLISLAAIHRDPEKFPQSDNFDIKREGNVHMSFGHGVHYCLGAPLARMEARIAFESLLKRFPDMKLAVHPSSLQWKSGLPIRGLRSLPVNLA